MAGNTLCGRALDEAELLRLANQMEGHPDNIVPALVGGCTVAVLDGREVVYDWVPLPPELRTVLLVPDFPMPTNDSRHILSAVVRREDAVFNLSRTALLVAALAMGRVEHLRLATQDRLHQPDRCVAFPAMPAIFAAALAAGALGACLSGAGSTILAFTRGREVAVADAMQAAAQAAGIAAETLITRPTLEGARVETIRGVMSHEF